MEKNLIVIEQFKMSEEERNKLVKEYQRNIDKKYDENKQVSNEDRLALEIINKIIR